MADLIKPEESNLIDGKEFNIRFQEWVKEFGPLIQELGQIGPETNVSWGYLFEENAKKFPDNTAIKFEDKELTYKEFNELANQYANYFLSLGLKKGDVAKVLVKNRIEFLLIYTANAKIGVISSLINTDLQKKTLIHSLNLTPGKIMIVGEECFDAYNGVKSELKLSDVKNFSFIPDANQIDVPEAFINLPEVIKNYPVDNPLTTKDIGPKDVIAYIFTSGTTGLPKAARLTHRRATLGGFVFGLMVARFTPDDTFYIPLPFFHGTALMTGWPSILVAGGALALSRKFSTHHFWDEIRKFNAAGFNYVGEICRYLMNQPPRPNDSDNPVRVVIGNGLRPEIWTDFKKRFNIPTIGEFYGSSEGNIAFVNVFNFDNTCGYSNYNYAIVRYDIEEDKPIKNNRGFMRKVRRGDVGLLIAKSEGDTSFDGYTDEEATEAKLFRNVFKEGDVWFNTGDLMRNQGCSHTQFVDRLGDTFRWKGHNVSTTEIEQVLNIFDKVSMSCVYGIKIPNTDGRAGMAAIVPDCSLNEFDFKSLTKLFRENLTPYAIPIFIRFKSEFSTTHTFKFKKVNLKKEGFDVESINDPLYVILPDELEYVPLTKEIYEGILNQKYEF